MNGSKKWAKVVGEMANLGHFRSQQACRVKYFKLVGRTTEPRRCVENAVDWSPEEKEVLYAAAEDPANHDKNGVVSWKKKVVKILKDAGFERSVSQCRNCWQRKEQGEQKQQSDEVENMRRCSKCGELKKGHLCKVRNNISPAGPSTDYNPTLFDAALGDTSPVSPVSPVAPLPLTALPADLGNPSLTALLGDIVAEL